MTTLLKDAGSRCALDRMNETAGQREAAVSVSLESPTTQLTLVFSPGTADAIGTSLFLSLWQEARGFLKLLLPWCYVA